MYLLGNWYVYHHFLFLMCNENVCIANIFIHQCEKYPHIQPNQLSLLLQQLLTLTHRYEPPPVCVDSLLSDGKFAILPKDRTEDNQNERDGKQSYCKPNNNNNNYHNNNNNNNNNSTLTTSLNVESLSFPSSTYSAPSSPSTEPSIPSHSYGLRRFTAPPDAYSPSNNFTFTESTPSHPSIATSALSSSTQDKKRQIVRLSKRAKISQIAWKPHSVVDVNCGNYE